MYIEVDVEEGPNCWPLNRMFETLGVPTRVSRVVAPDPQGNNLLCQVTGWSESGPCAAYAVLVTDSGEGAVTLVYGGDQGIRLKTVEYEEPWDLESPRQWGEPCLLLDRDVEMGGS